MKSNPKILIVFYSRTGTTKKAVWAILNSLTSFIKSKKINVDIEEIIDTKDRSGAIGYLFAGKDATLKSLTRIKKSRYNSAKYDLIIIGTPVWAFTMSTPIRTYILQNKAKLNPSAKAAFFCTQGGSGSERTFREMEKVCGKKPVALLELTKKEVMQNLSEKKVRGFVERILM